MRHSPTRWSAAGEAVLGFLWCFTAVLLTLASGAVVVMAVGTHLLIRSNPGLTKIVTYDPSRVASMAIIPLIGGIGLIAVYLGRLRRMSQHSRHHGDR